MLDNFIKTIPPVTRSILLIVAIGMIMIYTGYLNPYDMYFSVPKILQGEVINIITKVWRLVTSLFFIKSFELTSIYQLVILYIFINSIVFMFPVRSRKMVSKEEVSITCTLIFYVLVSYILWLSS